LLPERTPHTQPEDVAGGLIAARLRVKGFVDALNDHDADRAGRFLCRGMADVIDGGTLSGIDSGTASVGAVTVTGDTGTAFVSYRPEGRGDAQHWEFGLVVQGDQWMLCRP
jgi:hypothetical protein